MILDILYYVALFAAFIAALLWAAAGSYGKDDVKGDE